MLYFCYWFFRAYVFTKWRFCKSVHIANAEYCTSFWVIPLAILTLKFYETMRQLFFRCSFLRKRRSVFELHSKLSRLSIGLPRYVLAFPGMAFLCVIFLSLSDLAVFARNYTQYFWFMIIGVGPSIVTTYICFTYGCQVSECPYQSQRCQVQSKLWSTIH